MKTGQPEKLSPKTRKLQKDPVRAFRYLHAGRDDKARPIFMRLYNNEYLVDQLCTHGFRYANPTLSDVTDSELTPPSPDGNEDEDEENSSDGGSSEASPAENQNGSGSEAAGGTEQPANPQQQQSAPVSGQRGQEMLDFGDEPSEQAAVPSDELPEQVVIPPARPSGPPPPPPQPPAISGSKGMAPKLKQQVHVSPPSRLPKLLLASSQSPGACSLTRQQLSAAAAAVAAARPRDQLRSSQDPPASIQLPAADLRHVLRGTAGQSALSGRSGAQLTAAELEDLLAVDSRLRSVKDLGSGSLDARLRRLIESREHFAEEMARYRRFFEAADRARDALLARKPEQRRCSRSKDRDQMSPQQRRRSHSRDRMHRSPPPSRKRSRSRDRLKSPMQRQHPGRR
jgi:hypothetical protein